MRRFRKQFGPGYITRFLYEGICDFMISFPPKFKAQLSIKGNAHYSEAYRKLPDPPENIFSCP